jgi:hypothetical protein
MVWFSGSFPSSDQWQLPSVEPVTVAIYLDRDSGDALWQEAHTVTVAADGRYYLLLGSMSSEGLPMDLFTSGEPRWLGVRFHRTGVAQPPRVHLTSVPYALKAVDADTLGGRPASAYLLAADVPSGAVGAPPANQVAVANATAVANGNAGYLARFIDATNLGNSAMFQNGTLVGVGTVSPVDSIHVSFDDALGRFTGYAVQNRSSAATAYSGMLFYDQNGALAQFQGFNNATHEYRINNIAANGSINFMIGGSSKLLIDGAGNIGINAAPGANERLRVAGNVTVDGNIGAKYQDVAEWVETATPLEAGTVVIVDPSQTNRVVVAATAYDTRVAGAVSQQPGLVLGERGDSKEMVAQSGRVRVKVDAGYGAIRLGDLLVTSATAGHAMRSRPLRVGRQFLHRPGTVLGKALEALPSGKGEILVLLTLQ